MRADSSAASIMEGGSRGGGYGPTLNFPTIFPSHSLTAAAAAAAAAAPTATATGAPLAYIPARGRRQRHQAHHPKHLSNLDDVGHGCRARLAVCGV